MKEELTLLSLEDVFGKFVVSAPNKLRGRLEVIEKYGATTAIATDLALATGAFVTDTKNNECEYFLKDFWSFNSLAGINRNGEMITLAGTRRSSIRPVLVPSNFDSSFSSNDEIVEYGEYPQDAASLAMQKELNDAFMNRYLKNTGMEYTLDETSCIEEKPFIPNALFEFEYKNKKYICVKVDSFHYEVQLSNGGKYYRGDEVWIEVSPVRWLVDHKAKKLVSSKVLLSGIRACSEKNPINHFEYSEIKEYLDKYMLPEMIGQHTLQKATSILQTNEQKSKSKKIVNPYGLNFDKVSEEDIIRGSIESNVPVFLHGPSSEGKSARVKQIDSTCEIIYLRNATPEGLNGKSVYNAETGEMIDIKPTWLKKLEEKCQSEPDKLHVLFFDELTNALPSIQGMAFNIVLDREVNGIWRLPENARIVAAGNEMDDSLAANQLAEPLFNRFAHVNIKTTTENWLKWASVNNIHPAIYAFIAYKGEGVLRSKYDGKKPNADPRKWEMASKVLYATGNPKMLRSLVGEEITREFVAFCNEEVITLEDVINGNYTNEEIDELNTAEMYATTMGLVVVDEDNLEVVRNFAQKLGGEYRNIFDTLWTHNDESRLEKIAELNQNIDSSEELNIDLCNCDSMEMTLLTKEEIISLDVLRKYGAVIGITDLAISTDADLCVPVATAVDEITNLSTSYYYTKTSENNLVIIVDSTGNFQEDYAIISENVIRPVLLLPQRIFSHIFKNRVEGYNGTYEVEFGEYPQFVSYDMQDRLTNAFNSGQLSKTNYEYDFYSDRYVEYEYENERYIFVVGIFCEGEAELSDAKTYEDLAGIWIKVAPVRWLIDEENHRLISKYGLLSGVSFDIGSKDYKGNFEITHMYKFMNEYMLKDILHSCKLEEKVKKKLKK